LCVAYSGADKAPEDPTAGAGARGHDSRGPQGHRRLKFVVGFFGLDSILLTEGSILDPCYDTKE
jgi:hypothetical protein